MNLLLKSLRKVPCCWAVALLLSATFCCVHVVEPFSANLLHIISSSRPLPAHLKQNPSPLRLLEEYMSEDYIPPQKADNDEQKIISNSYGLGGVDLSARWMELVSDGHITAITELKTDDDQEEDDERLRVRYGVKLNEQSESGSTTPVTQQNLLEFVEILSSKEQEERGESDNNSNLRERIMSINATLSEMQAQSSSGGGMAIKCIYDGPYAIQLQLVRTLRPPRSKEMSGNNKPSDKSTLDSCRPPQYDSTKDSFLVGPLRLYGEAGNFHGEGEPRERAAQIQSPRGGGGVPWDIFHNISPVDPRGHFLLLPNISDENQWRDQSLNADDCYDLTYLASTIEPRGSMIISFNSVSAGASQNHIHAHVWPNPPPPLLYRNDPTAEYDSVYAVGKAKSLASFDVDNGVTKVSLLKYPCTCVRLSAAGLEEEGKRDAILKEMGGALSKIISIAQKMEIPHNVVWTNNEQSNSIETYIFFRKSETVLVNEKNRPTSSSAEESITFRLGASEMMGVFHTSSEDELYAVKKHRGLSCYGAVNILSDISYEPHQHVWAEVSNALGKTNRRLAALKRAELYKKKQ